MKLSADKKGCVGSPARPFYKMNTYIYKDTIIMLSHHLTLI